MSKYSTEELIKTLRASNFSWIFKSEADAIIAKLRAADKLCEAARGITEDGYGYEWKSPRGKLAKAIADYEGKK